MIKKNAGSVSLKLFKKFAIHSGNIIYFVEGIESFCYILLCRPYKVVLLGNNYFFNFQAPVATQVCQKEVLKKHLKNGLY